MQVFQTELNDFILVRDQNHGIDSFWLRRYQYSSFQLFVYVLTKHLFKALSVVISCRMVGLVFSFRSIVWCGALIFSKRTIHKFLYSNNISVISNFDALSITRERSTINCQFYNQADLSRFSTWGSCCFEAAGPSSWKPSRQVRFVVARHIVMMGRNRSDSWLLGVNLVISSSGRAKLK